MRSPWSSAAGTNALGSGGRGRERPRAAARGGLSGSCQLWSCRKGHWPRNVAAPPDTGKGRNGTLPWGPWKKPGQDTLVPAQQDPGEMRPLRPRPNAEMLPDGENQRATDLRGHVDQPTCSVPGEGSQHVAPAPRCRRDGDALGPKAAWWWPGLGGG